jgi:nonribosomal peptide synthetase DhbF
LREHLKRRLPQHMLPAAIVQLAVWPLTPNGKLDLRGLPPPQIQAEASYVEPRTRSERMLADLWAQSLGIERVGIHDNFFDLGGHSLLAIQVMSQMRAVFSVELPLHALFEEPDLAALAKRVEERTDTGDWDTGAF